MHSFFYGNRTLITWLEILVLNLVISAQQEVGDLSLHISHLGDISVELEQAKFSLNKTVALWGIKALVLSWE